jgi:hypothetical protein
MSTDVEIWFSAGELSLLGEQLVASLPTTMRGCTRMAQRKGWKSRKVKGGGGKGGIRTEYHPPAAVLTLIQSFLVANPDFFAKSKTRTKADPVKISKEVFGDAPARLAANPNMEFEAMLKRVSEASQATVRISKLFGGSLPVEWTSLIQELMAMHGLSEAGAARVIEALKQQT